MALSITTTMADDQHVILAVAGEVDVSNASELRDAVEAACTTHPNAEVEVNIAEVPYIDSTGIGVLVGAAHRASEREGRLVVSQPQSNVARILALLGVDESLNLRNV